MRFHFSALVIWMRLVLEQCGCNGSHVHQPVKVLWGVVVGQPDRAKFSVLHRLLHGLVCHYIVVGLGVVQNHQVNVI